MNRSETLEKIKQQRNLIVSQLNKIGNTFFMIECALSQGNPRYLDFYCTSDDSGTSSIFKPSYFAVLEKIKVPTITLKDFFDLFPWDRFEYIEHLKIDAQASDYDIIKGAGDYLREKVLYLSVETNTGDQYESQENPLEMKEYIESCGFHCNWWKGNGNFSNIKFKNLWDSIEFKFLETD